MNKNTLTPFQMWCVFLMFKNNPISYAPKELLMECCDSAISQLDPNHIDDELNYLSKEARLLDELSNERYVISNEGIVVVRQKITNIIDACKNNKIKKEIIQQQDQALSVSLNNKSPELKEAIVYSAVKNIGPIISLLNSLL